MLKKTYSEDTGFTLIELLITVTIIGILAAVAIPQFSAYRLRGYNIAAASDLRNIVGGVKAFQTEWLVFPSTAPNAKLGRGELLSSGVFITEIPSASLAGFPQISVTHEFRITSGVIVQVNTDTIKGQTFLAGAKHTHGDKLHVFDLEGNVFKFKNEKVQLFFDSTLPDATYVDDFSDGTTWL